MASLSNKNRGKKPVLALTPKAIAGWLVAIFIVSAWMFGMGVMVGRGTAPVRFDLDRLKKKLESLKMSSSVSKKEVVPIEAAEMKDKTKLDFYEDLPKNREDADMPVVEKPPASVAAKETAPQKPPEPSPAPQKIEKPAIAPIPVPAPAPPHLPPATAAPGMPYTVQVAAVRTEEEARSLIERLRQRGYAAYIEPIGTADKGIWYRVRMGEFPSKEFAGSTLNRLKNDGFAPVVVPK